jgi:decaprenylphospho-beta-D-ribofuranose 2-oxidase
MIEPAPWPVRRAEVRGWAGTRAAVTDVARPATVEALQELVARAGRAGRSLVPRAGGQSYADAFLNHDLVVDLSGLAPTFAFDPQSGQLDAGPGIPLERILAATLSTGWALASVPGTAQALVGGAIAADVHGKGPFRYGTFGDGVVELEVITAGGERVRCSRRERAELFRGVVGGFGLCGILVRARLQLARVPSQLVETATEPVSNLDELEARFRAATATANFAYAWVDAYARGGALGRGILRSARWLDDDRATARRRGATVADRLLSSRGPLWPLLRTGFSPSLVRAANAVAFTRARPAASVVHYIDHVFVQRWSDGWRSLYGAAGLNEIQLLVPDAVAFAVFRRLLELGQRRGFRSNVCVVKRHRRGDGALQFAGDGFSMTVELSAADRPGRRSFLRELIELVAGAGGRIYLVKDDVLERADVAAMYPALDEFLRIKRAVDPREVFSSGLYHRLLRA